MNMYPKTTARIIEFLLRNIPEEFNVNQIARQLKISVGGSHHTLKTLLQKGILNQRRMGNALYYRLNLENEETRKICELVMIESRNKALSSNPHAKVYATGIGKVSRISKAIILFGSILTKKEKARDVDVLFLVERKNIQPIEEACLEISRLRTKTANPLFMTIKDFKRNISKKDAVTIGILRNGIILSGEDILVESLRTL